MLGGTWIVGTLTPKSRLILLTLGLFFAQRVSDARSRGNARPLARLTYMGELDIRLLLRLLRDDPEPDPMPEPLVEMYREWCGENSVEPSSAESSMMALDDDH